MPIDPRSSSPSLRLPWLVASLALVALPAACGGGLDTGGVAESAPDPAALVGNPAPDFSVSPIAAPHGVVSLKALRGHVVLVDFWGTYCGPCKQSFPKLQELSAKYGPNGLHVVGISEDEADDKDKIAAFAATYGAKFTIACDEDKSIAHRYKPDVMPSSYVIDKRGVVRYAHVGYHAGDEVTIRKEVEALLDQ